MKKTYGEYYLGLDIGTNSVGWAVTDPEYNVLRFNSKAMWGIHLFNEGEAASERRSHRCARRRLERRNQRIALLRELFDSEVSAVDSGFFARLDESNLVESDRKNHQKNSLFNDDLFKDKEYHDRFPTIYHLRKYLMTTDEKPDIRLFYLGVHHILKNRGHFLFEGLSDGSIPIFEEIFSDLVMKVNSELNMEFNVNEAIPEIKELILNRKLTKTDKKKKMIELLSATTEQEKSFAALLSGSTVKLASLMDDVDKDSSDNVGGLSFANSSLEESRSILEGIIDEDRIAILDLMKAVYDWGILSSMLNNHEYLSDAKITEYNQHRDDLALLKYVLKVIATENDNDLSLYNQIMKSDDFGSYSSYSGMVKDLKDQSKIKFCTQEEFCGYVLKKLEKFDFDKTDKTKDMKERLENGTFMPKQRTKENSVLPNALHSKELNRILENMSRFYPFLNEADGRGKTIKEKIGLLCTFRVPYYVGPLNKASKYAWAVHRTDERVLPWNIEDVIDIEKTSEEFINKLVSSCTYLVGKKVMPKCSVIYQRFKLYNEINLITINGKRIENKLKREIIDELFIKSSSPVTKKKIAEFVTSRTGVKDLKITGIDEKIASNLKIENQLRDIIGEKINNHRFVEEMIRAATIFGDDRRRLQSILSKRFGDKLSPDQIKKIARLNFKDWGNLSEEFLTGIYSQFPDGREMNIITAMESESLSLQELLSKDYQFKRKVDEENSKIEGKRDGRIRYSMVEDLYCSPAVKHAIWRTVSIVKEIVKIMGHNPSKVFIETTREKKDDGRKSSRKDDLVEKYKAIKDCEDYNKLFEELDMMDNARLRSKKLFAYFMQQGRCVYCGKRIDLNDINNNTVCDIDHIYPQSKVVDDSINNTVLSCRDCNITKMNKFPIEDSIQQKMSSFWKILRDNKFMSPEKYDRLTRKYGFTDEELNKFVARQLVETSQSVKAVAKILEEIFKDDSDIVYVKGSNVSEFRHENKDRGYYTKCRNVNDYHHAKDAYLNIVVGNIYDTKFTKDPLHIVRTEQYNISKMFTNDVERNGKVAWKCGENGTISTVDKWMRRNNILFTRYPFKESGQLFNATIYKKGDGSYSIKEGMDICDYGGYDSVSGAFFSLVEHTVKKKRQRSIEYVPIVDAHRLTSNESANTYFAERNLIDPEVRVKIIRFDSLFEIDGFRLSLSGRTGDRIILKNSEQLVLSFDNYNYCKKIFKFIDEQNGKKMTTTPDNYGLNVELNIKLYDELGKKACEKYSAAPSLSNLCNTIEDGRDKFISLDLTNQVKCLNSLLTILQCNSSRGDLTGIGGGKFVGTITLSKVLQDKETLLVFQSPSGLFEKKIDLMKI